MSIFLEFGIVMTFTRYIDSDMEKQAYAIHLIRAMIETCPDPAAFGRLVETIMNDEDAIDSIETVSDDGPIRSAAYRLPDLGIDVSPAHDAQIILSTQRIVLGVSVQRERTERNINLRLCLCCYCFKYPHRVSIWCQRRADPTSLRGNRMGYRESTRRNSDQIPIITPYTIKS